MIVKLIDFGLARRVPLAGACMTTGNATHSMSEDDDDEGLGPDGLMTTPVGTPHFVAPEVLSSLPYGKEVDLFACGVILYWLLSAKLPFEDPDPMRLAERIKRVEFDFANMVWDGVSNHAKDLVTALLDRSPISRLSASLALSHAWFYAKRSDRFAAPEQQELGNQIVVREWTVDPGFNECTPELQSQLSGTVHPSTGNAVPFEHSLKYAITSPVTPHQGSRGSPFGKL